MADEPLKQKETLADNLMNVTFNVEGAKPIDLTRDVRGDNQISDEVWQAARNAVGELRKRYPDLKDAEQATSPKKPEYVRPPIMDNEQRNSLQGNAELQLPELKTGNYKPDLGNDEFFKTAKNLDRNSRGLSDDEAASYLIALAMTVRQEGENLTMSLNRSITKENLEKAKAEPEHVSAIAKQIFGDKFPDASKTETLGPVNNFNVNSKIRADEPQQR